MEGELHSDTVEGDLGLVEGELHSDTAEDRDAQELQKAL